MLVVFDMIHSSINLILHHEKSGCVSHSLNRDAQNILSHKVSGQPRDLVPIQNRRRSQLSWSFFPQPFPKQPPILFRE